MTSQHALTVIVMLTLGSTVLLRAEDPKPAPTLPASPSTFYVNSANPAANDGNTGTQAAPWLTIQHGITTANPGDTIVVMPGQYGRTMVTKSGTKDLPITLKGVTIPNQAHVKKDQLLDPLHPVAFPGNLSANAVTQGFDVSGASFVSIEHFEITAVGAGMGGIFLKGAENIHIVGNFLHDLNPEKGHWGGIRSDTHDVKNILVKDNTLFRCHGSSICVLGDNWIVEGNEVSHGTNCRTDTGANVGGEDALRLFGTGHVIRYNYLHDFLDQEQFPKSEPHLDAFQTFSVYPEVQFASHILIEKNYCYNIGQMFMCSDTAEQKNQDNKVHHITLTGNVFRKTNAYAVLLTRGSDNMTFTNNVVADAYYGALTASEGSHHAIVLNNIFFNNGTSNTAQGRKPNGPVGFDVSSQVGTTCDYNIYSHDFTYPKKIAAFDTHSTYGVDPKFMNPEIGDYRLQNDSPAIGAGDPSLTSANGKRKNIGAYQGDDADADWMLRWIKK